MKTKILLTTIIAILLFDNANAKSWVDSLAAYEMNSFMPAVKYTWNWGPATLLNSIVKLYRYSPDEKKQQYLEYLKTAIDTTFTKAHGRHPNAVASGHGMAFIAGMTKDPKYMKKALEIYQDYKKIPVALNGGVSHRAETIELWDDTIYMIGMFLLEMYRQTGDVQYIAEFTKQVNAHSEKLADKKEGFWVHGYDDDKINFDDKCCMFGWPDSLTRSSKEFWGRGNGWISMALADALNTIPRNSKYWNILKKEFISQTKNLPKYQNKISGHWYQLLNRVEDPLNYEESSCTAMFGYALTIGIKLKILDKKIYKPVVDRAYSGLRQYSMAMEGAGYLKPVRVCEGTCIGDKNYYFKRKAVDGTPFAGGAFILFGAEYEKTFGKM